MALADRRSLKAIASLSAGVLVFSLQDVIIKTVSGSYPVHEVVAIRCIVALPLLLAILHRQGGMRGVLSPRMGWLALRGAILIVAYTTYYLALPVLPLASVVALYFTVPLFVTAMAGPFLGEKIGLHRWAATLAGFGGVIVMMRPTGGLFDLAALLPVVAAMTYGAAQLMARRLGATDSAPVMAFYQNLMFLIGALAMAALFSDSAPAEDGSGSLAFLTRSWSWPGTRDLLLMAACGPIAAAGMVLLTQAYRLAEANLVASFEYTGLIWASLWGFSLWGEIPGASTLAGAALIVGAGLYVLYGGRARRALPVEGEIRTERV
ncbi:MAG: DMT family transporter [Pseudomonadota bacterium]